MKTNRKAVYDGPQLRVVSLPNGLWQCQHRAGDSHGSNASWTRNMQGTWSRTGYHFDPWQPVARPTSFQVALDQLSRVRA